VAETEPAASKAPDEAASLSNILGLRKAVLIIFRPKVMPDKVGCDLKEIIAIRLHSMAINTPPTGINIDNAPKTSATMDRAFILSPYWF